MRFSWYTTGMQELVHKLMTQLNVSNFVPSLSFHHIMTKNHFCALMFRGSYYTLLYSKDNGMILISAVVVAFLAKIDIVMLTFTKYQVKTSLTKNICLGGRDTL